MEHNGDHASAGRGLGLRSHVRQRTTGRLSVRLRRRKLSPG